MAYSEPCQTSKIVALAKAWGDIQCRDSWYCWKLEQRSRKYCKFDVKQKIKMALAKHHELTIKYRLIKKIILYTPF